MANLKPRGILDDWQPDESRGTSINVALSLLASISAIFLALRLYRKLRARQKLWWDDYILTASWMMLLGAVITSGIGISRGFGKHLYAITNFWTLGAINLLRLILLTFLLVASMLSKTSFAVTLLGRVDRHSRWRWFLWVVIASTNLVISLAVVFQWVACLPVESIWNPPAVARCWNRNAVTGYILFAMAYSVVIDMVLTISPWRLMSAPQLSWSEKSGAVAATCMGLFATGAAIATTVMRQASLKGSVSLDQLYDVLPNLAIWGSVEVALTIIAVSILSPRMLVRKANSLTRRGPPSNDGIEVSTK